jgi:hypothetical protein
LLILKNLKNARPWTFFQVPLPKVGKRGDGGGGITNQEGRKK